MSTSAPAQEEKRTDSQTSLGWKPDGLIGRGRFRLVRFIAQGGMGIVWEAFDQKLKESVAVKTLPLDLRSNLPAYDHLRREIVRNRAVSHPNIVRIHDLSEEEGEDPFIVMELVDGRGLNEWQAEQDDGVFDWEWFKPFLLQICDALAYAHQRNIVHRDLKPANVLLGADGQIKIIDFGLATHFTDALHPMSRSLGASGTTAYMSPQQVEGWPSTAQDDIYALGATLFELLTGQPPFVGGDLAHQVANHPPPKLQERVEQRGLNRTIPGEAELFVGACLVKDTAVRPKTVESLVPSLQGTPQSESSTPEVSPAESTKTIDTPVNPGSVSRKGTAGLKLLMGALVVGGAVAVALWGPWNKDTEIGSSQASSKPLASTAEAILPGVPATNSVFPKTEEQIVAQIDALQSELLRQREHEFRIRLHQSEYYETELKLAGPYGTLPQSVEVVRRPSAENSFGDPTFRETFGLGPGKWTVEEGVLSVVLDGKLGSSIVFWDSASAGVTGEIKMQDAKLGVWAREVRRFGGALNLWDVQACFFSDSPEWSCKTTCYRRKVPSNELGQTDFSSLLKSPWAAVGPEWVVLRDGFERRGRSYRKPAFGGGAQSDWFPFLAAPNLLNYFERPFVGQVGGQPLEEFEAQIGIFGSRSFTTSDPFEKERHRRMFLRIERLSKKPAVVRFRNLVP